MNRFLLFLALLTGTCGWSFAQETPAPTVEERVQKTDPTRGRALVSRERVNYLVLDYGKQRRRFFVGDEFKFRRRSDGRKYREVVSFVTDSSFSFSVLNEVTGRYENVDVPLTDVRRVYLQRRIPWLSELGALIPYFAALTVVGKFATGVVQDDIGNAMTNYHPIELGIYGAGVAGIFLSKPSYKINGRHRLRVLKTY
jgi:hypothetical protein